MGEWRRIAAASTLFHAGIIYLIDSRHIVEAGTHEQPIAIGGSYAASSTTKMREVARA